MSRHNLSFKQDEEDLADWLKVPGNPQKMKDAARRIMEGKPTEERNEKEHAAIISVILWATIGHDLEEGYYPNKWNIPGEEAFIRIGLEKGDLTKILRNRVFVLNKNHPAEAEEVIAAWIRKYPKTAAAAGLH